MPKKKELLHTDSDMEITLPGKLEDNPDTPVTSDDPQTDLKSDRSPPNSENRENESGENGLEAPENSAASPEIPTESGEKDSPTSKDPPSKEEKPKRKRTVKPIQAVMSIDAERKVETDEDKAKNDLLDLYESMKVGRILSDTVQGVELTNNDAVAVLYHGSYKILIPFAEFMPPPSDYRNRPPRDVHHYLINKRLGGEVDYIVKGIDSNAYVAVASRTEAMRAKRKKYYFGTDRNGYNILYQGVVAEARVTATARNGLFADIFGLEVFINVRELSYQRLSDTGLYFQPGQRILVKILTLDRSDKENIKVTASVRQATESPYEKAIRRLNVGDRYVGTVSMVDTNGVFVSLDGGIDCLCPYPLRGRPPRGSRVTVRILGIDQETNRIWGSITHFSIPR